LSKFCQKRCFYKWDCQEKNDAAAWEFEPYKAWMAYTAIIFLSKVRFADGAVWRQDKHKLAKKITEATNLMFKEEQLEEKGK